jgi:flagellar motor switch protein FliG
LNDKGVVIMAENEKKDAKTKMSGAVRAAILISYLPEETSRKLLENLDMIEREYVTRELIELPYFEPEIVEAVIKEYLEFMGGEAYGSLKRGADYVVKLMQGFNSDQIEELMGRIHTPSNRPFDSLKRIRDVTPILAYLHNEDPQTIAVIASHMKPSQAAELLQSLPEEKMIEVAIGIATMEQTNKDVLQQVETHLNKKLHNLISNEQSQPDGIKTLVSILNNVKRNTEKTLFERMDEYDMDLSKTIKDNMFVFEDIVKLPQRSLQSVVAKITDNELIARALKGASEELKEKFYQSMSSNRKDMVVDAIEGLGPLRLSDVEEAQQKIASQVKEMEQSGEIVISRGEEDAII